MSDDTPAVPGPAGSEEPVTANPVEEPTAPSAEAPAPTPPETSDATPDASPAATPEPAPVGEAAEAPTEAAEAPTQVAAAAPVAGAPAPVAAADRGRGVFVPVWVAAVVGVLVVAGLGFLIGWIAAPGDSGSPSNAVATAPNGQSIPNLPVFPGNGNGNGNQNGNGSSGSNDDNSDSTPSLPSQSRVYLGVSLDPSADDGPTIASVQAGSPAAKAGLQAGDVITKVDGDAVETPLDAVQAIREHDPGDTVTVTYARNGSTSDVKVTLATTPTTQSAS